MYNHSYLRGRRRGQGMLSQVRTYFTRDTTPTPVMGLARILRVNPEYLYQICARLAREGVLRRVAPGTYAPAQED